MKQQLGISTIALLCLTACIVFNGCAALRKKDAAQEELESLKSVEQPEALNTPAGRGYLSEGSTIKVETEAERTEGTIIEQFEKTSLELIRVKKRLSLLTIENNKLKSSEESLQVELSDCKEKLIFAQLLLIENEFLSKEVKSLQRNQPDLKRQIAALNEKLLESQIAAIKIKQELVNTRIQNLQGQKEPQKEPQKKRPKEPKEKAEPVEQE